MERDLPIEQVNMYCAIRRDLTPRMPPGEQPDRFALGRAIEYVPPADAGHRRDEITAWIIDTRELVIPLWREHYVDPVKREEALRHLHELHDGDCPNVDLLLKKLAPVKQWVYLLRENDRFNSRQTAAILNLSIRKVKRLHQSARKEIVRNSTENPKKGEPNSATKIKTSCLR
ncbi:sigma factor-like helix-turn-helix DNA-binding protein [Actinoplanes sp. CA-030573]|uniref:sigma factor-like helix-turn-helix DNA-binding protein n=1 Tax=Actinoplanes sp. CA-030573 TaxID=3239898 RepID=UPI003D910523